MAAGDGAVPRQPLARRARALRPSSTSSAATSAIGGAVLRGARARSPAARRPRSIPTPACRDADTLGALRGRLGAPGLRRLCRGGRAAAASRRRPRCAGVKQVFTVAPASPTRRRWSAGGCSSPGPCDFLKGVVGDGRPAAGRPDRGLLRRPLERRQVEPDQRADRAQGAGAGLEHAGPDAGDQLLHARRDAAISSTCRATASPRRRSRWSSSGRRCSAPISPAGRRCGGRSC